MWVAVRQRFYRFHRGLMLTEDQFSDGLTKMQNVARSLRTAYYPGSDVASPAFPVGSWGKKTQVRPPNDVDMMFEIPFGEYQRLSERVGNVQSILLQEVREVLVGTFPATSIRGDGQVAQVAFNTLMVEVVPVFRFNGNQFLMPDTNEGGRWKTVDPFSELRDIETLDAACNGNVRALCQMMKLWKREQSVPLKSFQIELLVQEFMRQYEYRLHDYYWYDWHIRDFFAHLVSRSGGYLIVPGTGEVIWLGRDWELKAERAAKIALEACQWEHADYDVTAGQEWQKIFGNRIEVKVI